MGMLKNTYEIFGNQFIRLLYHDWKSVKIRHFRQHFSVTVARFTLELDW